jgi:hypothetical protein
MKALVVVAPAGVSLDSDHEIDRLRHRRADCAHRGKVRQAGGEKHVGSSFFKRLQAADGIVQARGGVEEIVHSRSQDKGKRECARRLRGCRNPFDSQASIVKWTVRVARRILDRASHESHPGRQPDGFRHHFRRVAEPLFQIRGDG